MQTSADYDQSVIKGIHLVTKVCVCPVALFSLIRTVLYSLSVHGLSLCLSNSAKMIHV